ncbi:MAG: carotenoid biosynthesis protein [Bacteroidota bacterium]|nr:carotenoid biosynthesis protein [Bacteroidota bacterium]
MRISNSVLQKIALLIVLLFQVSGAIGILFSPYKEWFVQNTTFNLVLMALLLIITQKQKNASFFGFVFASYFIGFLVEWIGIHTGALFGSYEYGKVLGLKYGNVPLLIGVNWFIIIYCTGVVTSKLYDKMNAKFKDVQANIKPVLQFVSIVVDGALLATFFDFIIEPVAVKLGFWKWLHGTIPFYNYVCWFAVSALLLTIFRLLPFDKNNRLAVHLFIVQVLFFLLLRVNL